MITLQPPNDNNVSETNWRGAWEELRALPRRILGQRITDEINADPEEVLKLRAALKQADAGKTRPYRKRRDHPGANNA